MYGGDRYLIKSVLLKNNVPSQLHFCFLWGAFFENSSLAVHTNAFLVTYVFGSYQAKTKGSLLAVNEPF
jgi:hypothetical protein